mmetsp:Transcript_38047/g.97207  ORF Transcript_38047/g.97207 Transcript_38047/m.97207 type:complete len:219 (+) Transcript_38047:385-1041(+)
MQRRKAYPRMDVPQQGHQQVHDLINVLLLHHGFRALRERHDRCVSGLPTLLVDKLPNASEDMLQHRLSAQSFGEPVDILLSDVVVRDVDVSRMGVILPIVAVVDLEHELHAKQHHLLHEVGVLPARLRSLLREGHEELKGHLPSPVEQPVFGPADRQHHGHDFVQAVLEGVRGYVNYLDKSLQALVKLILTGLQLLQDPQHRRQVAPEFLPTLLRHVL